MPDSPPEDRQKSLIAAYELDDSSFNPELDQLPSKALTPPLAPAEPERQRNPDGTFAKKESTPESPKHPRALVRLAKDLGMSDEDISQTDPDTLGETVYHLNAQRSNWSRDNQTQRYVGASEPTPAPAPAAPAPGGNITTSPDDGLGIDESQYDSALMGVLKSQSKRIRQLEQYLGQVAGHIQAQAMEEQYSQVDLGFHDLGDTYQKLFGQGRGRDMSQGDRNMDRRMAVVNSLRANPPKKQMSIRDAVKARATELFGDLLGSDSTRPTPEVTPAVPEDDFPTQWRNGGLAKPTERSGSPEPRGVVRAARAVAAKLREKGATLEDFEGPEEAGLPD